jgi:hypothetical protein
MSFSRYFLFRRRSIVRLLIFSMVAYILYISLVGFGKMDNYSDEESNDNLNVEYQNQNNNDNNNNQFLPHQINNVKKRNDIDSNDMKNVVAQPENNDNNQNMEDNGEKIRNILTIIEKYDNFKDYQNIKENGKFNFI